ncbi:MAG TPA: DUF2188 domain-containing protein [Thermoanaerobaculia bacterium]|nr:DUF2188 domain-containing protein [Thermoanaerobaculia bacterium]
MTTATTTKSKSAKSTSRVKKVDPNLPPPAPKGGNTGSKLSTKTMIGAAVAVATAAAAAVVAFRTASGDKRVVYHLMPHEKGWQVRKEGKDRAEKTFEKKQPARDYARDLADSNHPSQLVIHRTDGTIQTVHTYGE